MKRGTFSFYIRHWMDVARGTTHTVPARQSERCMPSMELAFLGLDEDPYYPVIEARYPDGEVICYKQGYLKKGQTTVQLRPRGIFRPYWQMT